MGQLRFQCVPGCTTCCQQSGYLYLTEGDLKRMAAFVGLTRQVFEKKYVYRTRHMLRMRKPRRSQCPFLGGSGCQIHPAKPLQCQAFPFWPELVGERAAWLDAAKYCPGVGRGRLVSIQAAVRIANNMREQHLCMYDP
ncbi:MAG: YkgJ family cysteine cluster protein [Bryobacteraceae bacterium]